MHRFGDIYAKVAARQGTAPQLSSEQKSKTLDVVHPVVIRHPFSGRLGLFVNEGFTVNIVGMPAAESNALLAELYAHSKRPEFACRHRWQLGDLSMWDNWGTVDRATGGYSADDRRLMHRTTLKSSMPFAALAAS